jgi:hypothetical protein
MLGRAPPLRGFLAGKGEIRQYLPPCCGRSRHQAVDEPAPGNGHGAGLAAGQKTEGSGLRSVGVDLAIKIPIRVHRLPTTGIHLARLPVGP